MCGDKKDAKRNTERSIDAGNGGRGAARNRDGDAMKEQNRDAESDRKRCRDTLKKIHRNKGRYRKRERCTDRVITERGETKTSLNTWIQSLLKSTGPQPSL